MENYEIGSGIKNRNSQVERFIVKSFILGFLVGGGTIGIIILGLVQKGII